MDTVSQQKYGARHNPVRQFIKKFLPPRVLELKYIYQNTHPIAKRTCPICGYQGWFGPFGQPLRLDAKCRGCGSFERHRLLFLGLRSQALGGGAPLPEPVLHFAPETQLQDVFRSTFADYRTADLFAPADLRLDLENIALDDASIGTVIANHVIEHVDDARTLGEFFRILRPGGILIVSTPIVEGWERTYEVSGIVDKDDRVLHFGQDDHVRYYGRDVRTRIEQAGFRSIVEYTAEGNDVIEYGLLRGEKIFSYRKPE